MFLFLVLRVDFCDFVFCPSSRWPIDLLPKTLSKLRLGSDRQIYVCVYVLGESHLRIRSAASLPIYCQGRLGDPQKANDNFLLLLTQTKVHRLTYFVIYHKSLAIESIQRVYELTRGPQSGNPIAHGTTKLTTPTSSPPATTGLPESNVQAPRPKPA